MNYDAIIFDLFGTLVDTFPPAAFAHVLSEIAVILRVPPQAFVHMWNVELWPQRARGDFATLDETFSDICQHFGVTVTTSQLQAAVELRVSYSRKMLAPRSDTLHTLTMLKVRGYKIGLISDCTMEVPQLWASTPLATLIDAPIFSCSVQLKKPDPRIYLLACEQLGVLPQCCLYIGDGASRELTGAVAVGMTAVLIRVPYEVNEVQSEQHQEEQAWQGARIACIKEVLAFV